MKKSNVIALMATYQPRFTKIVWDAVMSLAPQVDIIYLTVNNPYTPAEKHLLEMAAAGVHEQTGTTVHLTFLLRDLGDLAKLWMLKHLAHMSPDTTILVCDDDLIYPADYADTTVRHLMSLHSNGCCPYISYGGKQLLAKRPYTGWKESWARRVSVFGGNEVESIINIPLTGVTAFKLGQLLIPLNLDNRYRNNSDLLMAMWARRCRMFLTCPAFAKNWITYNSRMSNKATIWGDMLASPEIQKLTAALATEVMEIPFEASIS